MRGLLLLVTLAGCGERRAAAPAPEGADAAPAEVVAAAAEDHAGPPPPLATLDAARLDALAAVEVPGWTAVQRDRTATSLVTALAAPPLRALVTVAPCLRCLPIDLAAWRAIEPELRALMPGAVEDDPATRFELRLVEVAGRPCVASWELGAIAYGDEVEAAHGARLYCNDGATELVVRVDDPSVATAPEAGSARAGARRDLVEEAAARVAAAYLAAL